VVWLYPAAGNATVVFDEEERTMALETLPATPERRIAPRSEFRCVSCGYGVSVVSPPEECPMCRSALWEPSPWRPFTARAVDPPAA
jgi:hypothetical protein